MDKQSIIKKIKKHKKHPNLRFQLKEKTEEFTDMLFYTLFDIDTPVEDNLNKLEIKFRALVDMACWEINKPCG